MWGRTSAVRHKKKFVAMRISAGYSLPRAHNETQSHQTLPHPPRGSSLTSTARTHDANARAFESPSLPELPQACQRTGSQFKDRPTRHRFHALPPRPPDRVRSTSLRLLLHGTGCELSQRRNFGRRTDRLVHRSESIDPVQGHVIRGAAIYRLPEDHRWFARYNLNDLERPGLGGFLSKCRTSGG